MHAPEPIRSALRAPPLGRIDAGLDVIQMAGKSSKNLMSLSDDWWRPESTCKILSPWFIRHLLGLFFSLKHKGQTYHGLYTGFLLYHRDHLLSATAGHVIDAVNNILSNSKISVLKMRWVDGCEISGAESIPADNRSLRSFSTTVGDQGQPLTWDRIRGSNQLLAHLKNIIGKKFRVKPKFWVYT